MVFDGVAPDQIAVAHQVQAVVGVTLVQFAVVVGQRTPYVEVGDLLFVAQRFEFLVRGHDQVAVGIVVLEFRKVLAVHGQDALHIDFGPPRFVLEAVDQFGDVGHDLVGRDAGGQIVGADQQEELFGMPLDNRVEAVEQPPRTVGADAAVLDMAVAEQLGPLAAVGDRVAQKDDVARKHRKHLEKTAPLVVVFALGE